MVIRTEVHINLPSILTGELLTWKKILTTLEGIGILIPIIWTICVIYSKGSSINDVKVLGGGVKDSVTAVVRP